MFERGELAKRVERQHGGIGIVLGFSSFPSLEGAYNRDVEAFLLSALRQMHSEDAQYRGRLVLSSYVSVPNPFLSGSGVVKESSSERERVSEIHLSNATAEELDQLEREVRSLLLALSVKVKAGC